MPGDPAVATLPAAVHIFIGELEAATQTLPLAARAEAGVQTRAYVTPRRARNNGRATQTDGTESAAAEPVAEEPSIMEDAHDVLDTGGAQLIPGDITVADGYAILEASSQTGMEDLRSVFLAEARAKRLARTA